MDGGTLHIVATPIGNLEDITLRALRTLKECDCVYAEDTRVTAKLLARYGIEKPLFRLDAEMEGRKSDEVIARIEGGERVVYVSDAGTPGISDPGFRLVRAARARGVRIEAIPGPSSLTAALSVAGIPAEQFMFLGFLPHKKGRQTALTGISDARIPVVLFESPHRIEKLLKELAEYVPECEVTVCRELTKMHEEVISGAPRDIVESLVSRGAVRGEFVVIVRQLR